MCRILYNTLKARLSSYAGGCLTRPKTCLALRQSEFKKIICFFTLRDSGRQLTKLEYLVPCLLDQLRWALLYGALCHSLTLPSLLATGRAGVQENTPELCQSIAYMKVVKN